MKEIIHIQVGQCGNQMSDFFGNIDLNGSSLDDGNLHDVHLRNIYFNEVSSGKFHARSVLVDLEHASISSALSGPCSNLFHPSHSITSKDNISAGNNWVKGFYTEGPHLVEHVLDVIRKQVELAESFQGFHLAHAIGGGTGSGLGCLILSKLAEEYPDATISTFSVVPSPKVSDTVVEPYNAILTFHHLMEDANAVFLLDNESLYDICTKVIKIEKPTYKDLNSILGLAMSNITSSFRFTEQVNPTLKELTSNLIPHPLLHFLVPSIAPVHPSFKYSQPEITSSLFDRTHQLAACDLRSGKSIAATAVIRGQLACKEVTEPHVQKPSKWNVTAGYCKIPPPNFLLSGMLLSNNTCVRSVFQRVHEQFQVMFRRKAFLYGLKMGAAMDEMEYAEAGSYVEDLMNEYLQLEREEEEEANENETQELVNENLEE
eukprot:CAMPEP_0168549178 /NCGR_PEP_ID=MMETSP0413-20121227/4961_1 /TAXON_ID=136452 /ORGANISM="Filamoeba nolandi, Strain NC-AS-23-1" /LENGTH=430 /DNA_ID=CAMNT_0008579541 /DNA_START=814 /DNA_END=2107 /DNA_ORIENTATION=+